MRIAVILTGGTVGSTASDEGLAPDAYSSKQLIPLYRKSRYARADVSFEETAPFSVLSENMTVSHWNRLIATLRELNLSRYDGVIVTHGTDTLAYTAALLSVLWNGMAKPLWLVSADMPLTEPKSNGLPNFAEAVNRIAENRLKGVWIARRGKDGRMNIFPGYAARQCDPYTDETPFFSGAAPLPAPDGVPRLYALRYPLRNCVLCVFPYPGIDYRTVRPTRETRAILHGVYHSGTVPSDAFASFSEEWSERIPVYSAPLRRGRPTYRSITSVRNKIRPLFETTFETAYAVLTVAYSSDDPEETLSALNLNG